MYRIINFVDGMISSDMTITKWYESVPVLKMLLADTKGVHVMTSRSLLRFLKSRKVCLNFMFC